MSLLTVENLSFGFGDKTLLKDISLRLLKGDHAGLVGINGAGKSTFFSILTEKLIPDDGEILKSQGIKIGYLDQYSKLTDGCSIRNYLRSAFKELYDLEKHMIEIGDNLRFLDSSTSEKALKEIGRIQDALLINNFYNIDTTIESVANGLGISALGLETPVDKLSGGQRTKVKLAHILLKSYDILLLDEPTNYLDKEHIDWLADYLRSYENSFIVISHDTSFMNRITNVIFHIEFTKLKRYSGNYNAFLKQKDENSKKYLNDYNKQQKEIARMEDFINKNMVRASTTKRAQSRQKALDKIERLEKPQAQTDPHYLFEEAQPSGGMVFKSHNIDIGYNFPLIKSLNLTLRKGEKVAIIGCNGIGKSTLLKTIMNIIPPLKGFVTLGDYLSPLYFEQETKLNDMTALEYIWNEFPSMNQKDIRSSLARCGLKQEHILQNISKLSGGEQAKVRLCALMMKPSNWLILDEPTNHLDVKAKKALKDALISYKGTILLVCHEKEFYDGLVTNIWDMESLIFSKNMVG